MPTPDPLSLAPLVLARPDLTTWEKAEAVKLLTEAHHRRRRGLRSLRRARSVVRRHAEGGAK